VDNQVQMHQQSIKESKEHELLMKLTEQLIEQNKFLMNLVTTQNKSPRYITHMKCESVVRIPQSGL
jgi:hypothetical protein